MTDFEKVTGGAEAARKGAKRRIIQYRNKAGKDHVIEMIENTSNDMLGMTIKDIRDRMRGVGEILSEDEMILEDVAGGAKAAGLDIHRFDNALGRMHKKAYKVFTNPAGLIDLEELPHADRVAAMQDILEALSMPGKERLLLAGILASDDELDVPNLVRQRINVLK